MRFEYKETGRIKSYRFYNLSNDDRQKVFLILNATVPMYPHYLYENIVIYFGAIVEIEGLAHFNEDNWVDLLRASNQEKDNDTYL